MAKAAIKFTYQDYLLLPEDKRYELIEGDLFMVPSPDVGHQELSRDLEQILWEFVKRNDLGHVLDAPLDVVLSEEDVVQPDILYVSKERSYIIKAKNIQGAPDLVIEILSPATSDRDRILKRKLYAKYGVKEYWMVDPQQKSIEVLTLGKKGFKTIGVYTTSLQSPLLSGLVIDLSEIF